MWITQDVETMCHSMEQGGRKAVEVWGLGGGAIVLVRCRRVSPLDPDG